MFSYPLAPDAELRLLEPRHAEEQYALIDGNREHLERWLGWNCQSADERRASITSMLVDLGETGSFPAGLWYRGEPAGMIRLNPIHRGCTSLGYWLGEAYQGKGLVTLGCRALIHHAFANLGAYRIEIGTALENTRSQAVAERLGFTPEGIRRESYPVNGQYLDVQVYSLLAHEWQVEPVVLFRYSLDEETELRLMQLYDIDALTRLVEANREHLGRWFPWTSQTREERLDYLKSTLKSFAEGKGLLTGIWYQGELAGTIDVMHIDYRIRKMEFGYWLGERFQGKGLVTRSCKALIDYAFVTLGLNRIEISARAENTRSREVAERLGFTLEGTFRQTRRVGDRYGDGVLYSLLKEEWEVG
ncbi:MAG: GNAT family N-acetyltransferase [Armatimonadota bacterium]